VGQSAILHLSSHGSVHPRDAQLSFIAFTQSGDSLDREELLYFNDLGHLIIDNELTVLSACETSLGELVTGETTLSFASALATAGARSTVTTLWKVDDGATKELLLTFYRQLLKGDGRSNALSSAQAELRHHADFAHPYYWSGIVLYGKAGPLPKALIERDSWTNQLAISLLGMLLLAAGGGLSYLWRRKELVI
jgi:CHAT domain-containing protein